MLHYIFRVRTLVSTMVNMVSGIGIVTATFIVTGICMTSLFKSIYQKRLPYSEESSTKPYNDEFTEEIIDKPFTNEMIVDDLIPDIEMIESEKIQKNTQNAKYIECLLRWVKSSGKY